MVVKWHYQSKIDLKQYIEHSKIHTKDKIKDYVEKLVLYANSLESQPHLGKILYKYKDIEIRQLVYKMHKIFYYIKNEKIIIIRIVYSARDLDSVIKDINKYIY